MVDSAPACYIPVPRRELTGKADDIHGLLRDGRETPKQRTDFEHIRDGIGQVDMIVCLATFE
jgi:hypothetical protein